VPPTAVSAFVTKRVVTRAQEEVLATTLEAPTASSLATAAWLQELTGQIRRSTATIWTLASASGTAAAGASVCCCSTRSARRTPAVVGHVIAHAAASAAIRRASHAARASSVVGSKSALVRRSRSPRSAHSCSFEGLPQNQ
jgi:hypothetical protein